MERFYKYLDMLVNAILVVFLIVMLIVGFMQVFCRYVLGNALSWSEELLRYLYVWATMIGISMGIHKKALAVVSSFTDFIAKKSKLMSNVFIVVNFFIQIGLFTVLGIYGWQLAMSTKGQASPSMQFLSMGVVYLALPIGSILALIYTIGEIHSFIENEKAKSTL